MKKEGSEEGLEQDIGDGGGCTREMGNKTWAFIPELGFRKCVEGSLSIQIITWMYHTHTHITGHAMLILISRVNLEKNGKKVGTVGYSLEVET